MADQYDLNKAFSSPLVQIGLGILANNNSRNTGQVLGRGAQQGIAAAQRFKQLDLQNAIRQEQIKNQTEMIGLRSDQFKRQQERDAKQAAAIEKWKIDNPEQASLMDISPSAALKAANPTMQNGVPSTDLKFDGQGRGFMINRRETDPSKFATPILMNGAPITGAQYSTGLTKDLARNKAIGTNDVTPTDMIPGKVLTKTQVVNQATGTMQVPAAVQAQRDQGRDAILQSELEAETQALAAATTPEQVQTHERNIGLLNQELGNEPAPIGIKVPTKAEEAASVEAAKLGAKNTAEASSELPTLVSKAENALRYIDEMVGSEDGTIKPHAGFSDYVGATLLPWASNIDGTDAADFKTREDQLSGAAFLEAFESLKGGGQITEVEGKKATQAIQRMNKSLSEKEYVEAARDFQSVIRAGVDRAKGKAGKQPSSNSSSNNKVMKGQVMDGYKFKGGDPADENNWEAI